MIEYSDVVKDRIRGVQFDIFEEFVKKIPGKKTLRVIDVLPMVKGFRPGVPSEIDHRLRRFFSNIKNNNKDEDWSIILKLWFAYTEAYPGIIKAISDENLDEFENIILEMKASTGFCKEQVKKLVKSAYKENLSNDLLWLWILFSPFEFDEEVKELIKFGSPSNEYIALKERFNQIEMILTNISELVNNEEKEIIRQEITDLEQDISSLSNFMSDLKALIAANSNRIGKIEGCFTDIQNQYATFNKQINVIKKEIKNLYTEYDKVLEYINQLVVIVGQALEFLNNHKDSNEKSNLKHNEKVLNEDFTNEIYIEEVSINYSAEIINLMDEEEIIIHLEHNIHKLGITLSHAKKLSKEIYVALATGQLVIFDGSLALPLAERIASCLTGGKYTILRIPFGVSDPQKLNCALSKAIINSQDSTVAVILEGINRSAFELYGGYLKKIIMERVFRLNNSYDSILFFATTTEGLSVFPVEKEILQLGTLLSVDALKWTLHKSSLEGNGGTIPKNYWTKIKDFKIMRYDFEELGFPAHLFIKWGNLWNRNLILADTLGRKVNQEIEGPIDFCLFGWVFPMFLINRDATEFLRENLSRDDRLTWFKYVSFLGSDDH